MTDRVTLKTNGVEIKGFDHVVVQNRFDWLSGRFELGSNEAFSEDIYTLKQHLKKGEEYALYVDGRLILTGYIDKTKSNYADKKKSIMAYGRSKSSLIIDSQTSGLVYRNRTACEIIADIIAPFNLSLKSTLKGLKRFDKFSLYPAENLTDVLARLCHFSDALLYSAPDGSLVLTRRENKKTSKAVFKSGVGGNLLSSLVCDNVDFSETTLIGQGVLYDEHTLNEVCSQELTVTFGGELKRCRVLFKNTVSSDEMKKELQKQDKQLKNILLSAFDFCDVDLNTLVAVDESFNELNGKYLVSGFEFSFTPKTGHRTAVDIEEVSDV